MMHNNEGSIQHESEKCSLLETVFYITQRGRLKYNEKTGKELTSHEQMFNYKTPFSINIDMCMKNPY